MGYAEAVRIEDSQIELINLLNDWADWQRSYSVNLGFRSRSAGLQSGGSSSTFDDMCEAMDNSVCKVVDSAIDDLELHHRSAITHRYLAAVFRFPRLNYAEALNEAHDILMDRLKKRGVLF